MKTKLLFAGALMLGFSFTGFSQSNSKGIGSATLSVDQVFNPSVIDYQNQPKSIQCIDTIHYPLVKQQLLGPGGLSGFSTFGLYQVDNESVSQTFFGYSGMQINGVQILGYRHASSTGGTATVRASIYNVDGSNNPTGAALGSGTVTITSTTQNMYDINFASAISVTGNYAVVLDVTNAGGIYVSFYNSAASGQNIDEGLARYKSDDPALGSNGSWIPMTSITGLGQTVDFEPVVAPLVSYQINTTATVVPLTACLGDEVTFTNTTTTSELADRMYNYSKFRHHFGLASNDSTHVWDLDLDMNPNTSPAAHLVWNGNTTYTYATAGAYTPELYSLAGFWTSCVDYATFNVTINPIPDASFSYAATTVCAGGPNVTTSSVATAGGTFSALPAGLTINSATGEIDLSTSTNGTYTITYDLTGPCPSSSTQSITVTSAPDASFSYAAVEYCTNGSNPSPVFTTGSAGTFSSTTGLSIGANGVINLAASTPGLYTVTNEISAAGCPVTTETFDVTIEDAPTVSAGSNTAICVGASTTIAATGADSYSWDNGLGAGASHSVSPTNTTSYVVTGTATNGCTNTATVTVSINQLPTVSAGSNTAVCAGSSVTITASGASTYDWDNGLGAGASHSVSPTTATTYTVTGTDVNGCENTASVTITVNAVPTASMSALNTICSYYAPITLNQGSPAGGTYSGPGVSGTTFNPATAGVGTHTITYSVTQSGCTGTATATIEVSPCAGIESASTELLSVFPNPASSELNVVFENTNSADATIVLMTADGKIVYQSAAKAMSVFNEKINVTEFANGVYFIKIGSDKTAVVQKVVLN